MTGISFGHFFLFYLLKYSFLFALICSFSIGCAYLRIAGVKILDPRLSRFALAASGAGDNIWMELGACSRPFGGVGASAKTKSLPSVRRGNGGADSLSDFILSWDETLSVVMPRSAPAVFPVGDNQCLTGSSTFLSVSLIITQGLGAGEAPVTLDSRFPLVSAYDFVPPSVSVWLPLYHRVPIDGRFDAEHKSLVVESFPIFSASPVAFAYVSIQFVPMQHLDSRAAFTALSCFSGFSLPASFPAFLTEDYNVNETSAVKQEESRNTSVACGSSLILSVEGIRGLKGLFMVTLLFFCAFSTLQYLQLSFF